MSTSGCDFVLAKKSPSRPTTAKIRSPHPATCWPYTKSNILQMTAIPATIAAVTRNTSSHLRCEVRDYPITAHPKIRPFILYLLNLSEPRNNLCLLGKLTERQGRKVTDLRETMAAGLRHGCSSVCINCLPLRCLKIWKGERYV